jgi:NAD(P)-dependent dehydrogenase (short-subunit alcohol dehydrogenase family)
MSYRNPPPLRLQSKRLAGQVIFVAGASSGIGAASVRRFAEDGAIVVAGARRIDRIDALSAELRSEGHQVSAVLCDVRDEASVRDAITTVLTRHGKLTGAFNNAAVVGAYKNIHELPVEKFDEVIATNLRGVFICMKYEIAAMLAGAGGAIVMTSSAGGLVGSPMIADYAASKFGLEGLIRCAALEYARRKIRVNAIAPGPTDSEMLHGRQPNEAMRQAIAERTPQNYIAHPDDMARAAAFLLSEESRWTTGVIFPCDGGISAGPMGVF